MHDALFIVGFWEVVVFGIGVLVFTVEKGRLPGTRRNWRPYIRGDKNGYNNNHLEIGVAHKSQRVKLRELDLRSDNFADLLAKAESEARARCVLLNNTAKNINRKLP